MRSGLLAIVCTVLFVWDASGQDEADQAKYELIRETINFLATDKAVSQDTAFRISCETLDYDCFKQQLSSKPIAGIDRWYDSWRSMAATDEAALVALRNQVFADIFERPGKGYRKQLAGYEGYISRIEGLLHPPVDEPMEQIATDTVPDSLLNLAESQSTYPEQLTDQNDNPEKEDTMIAYLALAIGIIALIIAARPILKKKEQQTPVHFGLPEQLDELAVRMKRLEQKIADSQIKDEAIASLTEIMESVEKRVVELENSSKV
ncbi:hypothetical protein [Parapedobacter koreensis]|uniref:Uncharacterized protein n=1 Tax=Parapedobacter koreensis TaxID=332977 RepID=A0A1H7MSU7_9SPHI|nr:hypothetical protein [Parapedobacter koreensis]SEL14171.1 hypothetical protein SAMN05421740_103630 [Parapedobacter koreensis]